MPVFNKTPIKKGHGKNPGFKPGVSTSLTLTLKTKGKKKKRVVTHTDLMHHLGYQLFKMAAENGIDLTGQITPKGRLKPEIREVFETIFTKPRKNGSKNVALIQKFLNNNGS